jgi:acetyl-CoA synthetase
VTGRDGVEAGRTMSPERVAEPTEHDGASEAEIAAHWKEEALIPPPASFRKHANLRDPADAERFRLERFPEYFREYAELLTWERPWTQLLDSSRPPFYRWFVGGTLNAAQNCLDRHLPDRAHQAALVFQAEPESHGPVAISYQELTRRVQEFAALLRDHAGVRAGDRVTIHLPMVPELPVTMLACARLGAVHSVVFGGFSGEAAGHRAADAQSHVLVTMDGFYRNGQRIDHLAQVEPAVVAAAEGGQAIDRVLVWSREPGTSFGPTAPVRGRDERVVELLPSFAGRKVPPVPMDANAPLFLMYTSGTTGRPKGCQHSTGGYLAYVAGTSRAILDLRPDDVYWCMADIGWITGHSYIVYGPLALGATSVLYEGVPSYPDAGRPWRIAERLGVRIFHTSPTAIRQLRRLGPEEPRRHQLSFRLLTTVGEPIEPEAWRWYYEEVGRGRAAVVDTWWQTETGGFLCSTWPAIHGMKPGSTGPGAPGIHPVILDERGDPLPAGSGRAGNICIPHPWPGLMQTIWGDPERFVEQYFRKYNRDPASTDWRDWPYFAGDGAVEAADGYFRILGRVDDVINVAGHRLGAKEIESACLMVPEVAEAAVVPVHDALKGRVPEVYVALRHGVTDPPEAVARRVVLAIETAIGKIARPRKVHVVADMPKTRSGKIMRRVLAGISNRTATGETSTLANPEVVERIREQVERSD